MATSDRTPASHSRVMEICHEAGVILYYITVGGTHRATVRRVGDAEFAWERRIQACEVGTRTRDLQWMMVILKIWLLVRST